MHPPAYSQRTATAATAQSDGLRLDWREAWLKGGNAGAAIVIGQPDASLPIQAVSHTHEHLKMPQDKPKLKDDEIASLREWIKDAAYWPQDKSQIRNLKFQSTGRFSRSNLKLRPQS